LNRSIIAVPILELAKIFFIEVSSCHRGHAKAKMKVLIAPQATEAAVQRAANLFNSPDLLKAIIVPAWNPRILASDSPGSTFHVGSIGTMLARDQK
jgi:hypothetical protein